MLDLDSLPKLQSEVDLSVEHAQEHMGEVRREVRQLRGEVRRIQPHTATAVSLVAADGGDNAVGFDPLMLNLVRVVDSSNNEYCLEVVAAHTDMGRLNQRLVSDYGTEHPVGRLMRRLDVGNLWDLSPMIPEPGEDPKPSWIKVYRELMEWATLLELVERRFGTDTILVRDGFLRSKVFAKEYFKNYRKLLNDAIAEQLRRDRRKVFVAGLAKHSKVLQRYHLAMALEGVLRTSYPAYLPVPPELEMKVYKWSEYARGDEQVGEGQEPNRFVAGRMHFVKFGSRPADPLWAVDILDSQTDQASRILGYMLQDSLDGFPVPFYPMCLQRAHENAALVDLDVVILQDQLLASFRRALGSQRHVIDDYRLASPDPAAARYTR